MSSDQELFGGVINESGTITLSTGLGDNINLNFMADLSDDEERHEVGVKWWNDVVLSHNQTWGGKQCAE